jgi:hypothetical protein
VKFFDCLLSLLLLGKRHLAGLLFVFFAMNITIKIYVIVSTKLSQKPGQPHIKPDGNQECEPMKRF